MMREMEGEIKAAMIELNLNPHAVHNIIKALLQNSQHQNSLRIAS